MFFEQKESNGMILTGSNRQLTGFCRLEIMKNMKNADQTIRVLILEDETIYAVQLTRAVQKVMPDAAIRISSRADLCLDVLPDLAIIDIGLDGEVDGVSFMRQYGQQIPAILFYSICQSRMKETFGPNVLGFLEKNEDEDLLLAKLQQAKSLIQNRPRIWLLDENKRNVSLRRETITRITKEDHVYWIVDCTGKRYRTSSGKLDQCSEWLDERFVRISQSELVNREQVLCIEQDRIVLPGGQICYMSRRMKKDALRRLKG